MSINITNLEQNIKKLPPISEAVNQAIAIFNSANVDYDLIEQKVSKDPSLTARILKVANSSFYGCSGKVSSIKHAGMILGMPTTRNIIISAGVMEKLQKSSSDGLDINAIWTHSASTGAIARILAKAVGLSEAEAFTAGLLHDIGSMVLDIYFSDEYKQVLDYQQIHQCELMVAEEAILGFNHSQVGSKVATFWKLPEMIANTCEYHHNPLAEEASQFARIIYLANIISHNLERTNEASLELGDKEVDVVKELELSDSWLEPLLNEVNRMDRFESVN